ncbi:MAG: hypothetical protein QM731_04250 [Chitinophagaceae bacterium]
MRSGLTVTLFILSASFSYAQGKDKLSGNPNNSIRLTFAQPDTIGKRPAIIDSSKIARLLLNGRSITLAQAVYSHQTSRGKVYTMQPDNMPCLVPDMKQVASMPDYQPDPTFRNYIPNPYRSQKLIPPYPQVSPRK